MDYRALIDFNKYTLAIAAGGFVYTLEKFIPSEPGLVFHAVVAMLALFLFSSIAGVVLFSTATKSLHSTGKQQSQETIIRRSGIAHAGSLIVALLILGFLVFKEVVFAESPTSSPTTGQCEASQNPSI